MAAHPKLGLPVFKWDLIGQDARDNPPGGGELRR